MPPDALVITLPAALLLTLGAFMTYVASRSLAEPIGLPPSPARTALGHFLVIAIVALGALLAGRTDLAVGIVFASTIATLSLALGFLLALAKRETAAPASHAELSAPPGAAAWRLLIPAALVPLVGGFSGRLQWVHAVVLLAIGLMALSLWRGGADPPPRAAKRKLGAAMQFALAIPLALLGAALLLHGVGVVGRTWGVPATALATVLIGPILVLPLISSGVQQHDHVPAERIAPNRIANCAALALLNICLLLPLLIAVDAARNGTLSHGPSPRWLQVGSTWLNPPDQLTSLVPPIPTTAPAAQPAAAPGLPLPLVIWRVDGPCLLLLTLLLLPLSLGRWSLSLIESELLALFYFLYVLAASQAAGI